METVKIKLSDEELDRINGGITVEKMIQMNGVNAKVWMRRSDEDEDLPEFRNRIIDPRHGKDVPGHNEDVLPGDPFVKLF